MQRVLVVRIGRLGDTILATPVIGVLQRSHATDVAIDFAASPGGPSRILEMDQRISRVFPIAHRSASWRLHRGKRALERHSREHPYDLVINLECGSECDDFIRFVHHREFCGRPLIEPSHRPGRHCVDTEKSIYAALLGPEVTAAAGTSLSIEVDATALPVAAGSAYVVINPGFSGVLRPGYRSHRGWPMVYWQTLVESLHAATGLSVLINGTTTEQVHFASLLEKPYVYSLFGSSLQTLLAALKHAAALVTVDTGTMHLGTALGTPVVALFGPTNPALTGPYSQTVPNSVLTSGVDCQPCVNTPLQKKCSFNRCMSEITPGQVLDACQRLLHR
ncbi:MAG: glycosyltransferase family 9 protein [Lysobacterales bacterium]